jgi:undecaprenyl-diphosphatase
MEQQILFLINRQWTNPAMDMFMAVITNFALWLYPLAILVVAVLALGRFRARAAVISLLLAVAVGDGLVAGPLKQLVGRPRPHEVLADVRRVSLHNKKPRWKGLTIGPKIELSRPMPGETIEGNSFPSAHTLDNFCAATILWAFYRRRGWLYFIPASLIAYSRMYTGSHWPSDVLISMFLGVGIGLLCLAVIEFLWKRLAPRLAPGLAKVHPSLFNDGRASLAPHPPVLT